MRARLSSYYLFKKSKLLRKGRKLCLEICTKNTNLRDSKTTCSLKRLSKRSKTSEVHFALSLNTHLDHRLSENGIIIVLSLIVLKLQLFQIITILLC